MTASLALLWVLNPVAAPVALVAVGEVQPLRASFDTAARAISQRGDTPLSSAELLLRLLGNDTVREPNLTALQGMLEDARQSEARFDAAQAQALRQEILRAFDATPRPTPELRQLTREAMQDWTASLLTENDQAGAKKLAQETWRRFGAAPLDAKRNSPSVRDFVSRVYDEQRTIKTGILHVKSDVSGELWLEARRLGNIKSEARYAVPQGTYRLWLVTPAGMSLPYTIHVGETAQVHLQTSLDAKLHVSTEGVRLGCSDDCDALLGQLQERLGVAVEPVRPAPAVSELLPTVSAPVNQAPAQFNYLSLVPLGGGQFFQDRPVVGGSVLAAEVGILAWHIVAITKHGEAAAAMDADAEQRWRTQRNISAVLTYTSIALGVAEALVYELAFKD